MKIFIVSLVILCSGLTFAQTNIIAAKSHASTMDDIYETEGNFGETPEMMFRTVELIYVNENCVVEVLQNHSNNRHYDTICNHPYFVLYNNDLNKIKRHYPKDMKFTGFKAKRKEAKPLKNASQRKGSLLLFGILAILLSGYVFIPRVKKG